MNKILIAFALVVFVGGIISAKNLEDPGMQGRMAAEEGEEDGGEDEEENGGEEEGENGSEEGGENGNEEEDLCRGATSGLVISLLDCSKYYDCNGDEPEPKQCGEGEIFIMAQNGCVEVKDDICLNLLNIVGVNLSCDVCENGIV